MRRVFKVWRRTGEKWSARGLFKFPALTNRSIGSSTGQPLGQRSMVNGLIFCIFSSRDPPPALFSWNPQFFMSNAKGILIFGQNLTFFLRLFLYDAYDMKFTQSLGIFNQEFIKESFDHKEITPSCLLISTNCFSLRGFVKISSSWFFMLSNSSVMLLFCAWSLRNGV